MVASNYIGGNGMRWLLCLLPPLAVLSCKKPGSFLLSIILTIIGYIPGVIHAILVVSSYKADKRTDRIVHAIERGQRY